MALEFLTDDLQQNSVKINDISLDPRYGNGYRQSVLNGGTSNLIAKTDDNRTHGMIPKMMRIFMITC